MAYEGSVEKRRWLVVGLCLHSVVIPPLREIIACEVSKVYNEMKEDNYIDTQTPSYHLRRIEGDWKDLNYRNINENHRFENEGEFDYKVRDNVSLVKLLMERSMAKFNAFDNSFDASAAITVLSTIRFFDIPVNEKAIDVNSKVRKKWAHPNFTEWTEQHYKDCFIFLEDLVKQISKYDPTWNEKSRIIRRLHWWKECGPNFCLGEVPEDDIFSECLREVKTFSKSFADFRGTLSKEVDRQLRETYASFESSINSVVQPLEERQATSEKKLNEEIGKRDDGEQKLRKEVKQVVSTTKSLGNRIVELAKRFAGQEKKILELFNSFKTEALEREGKMSEEFLVQEEKILLLFESFKADVLKTEEQMGEEQKQQISRLFESVEVAASESEGKVTKRVISLSNRLILLEQQQKTFKDKFYEMEMKITQLERENEELKKTNHELQLKLEGFEAPPRHSGLGS